MTSRLGPHDEPLQPVEMVSVADSAARPQGGARAAARTAPSAHLQFEPRQRRADAEMDAGAERDVLLVAARPGRKRSGSAKARGSRLAMPSIRPICSPGLQQRAGVELDRPHRHSA